MLDARRATITAVQGGAAHRCDRHARCRQPQDRRGSVAAHHRFGGGRRRSGVDIVVELIGGTDPALTLVRTALENGKPVITGNKELLAAHEPELYAVAAEHGVDLLFEAAVAGASP